jgi:hypothetical protein
MFFTGCATIRNPEESALANIFYKWRDSLLAGDVKEVYRLTSSASKSNYKSFDEWERDYEANKNEWRQLFKDARVLLVAIEGSEGSLLIKLGSDRTQMLTAVREEGSWKIGKIRK